MHYDVVYSVFRLCFSYVQLITITPHRICIDIRKYDYDRLFIFSIIDGSVISESSWGRLLPLAQNLEEISQKKNLHIKENILSKNYFNVLKKIYSL